MHNPGGDAFEVVAKDVKARTPPWSPIPGSSLAEAGRQEQQEQKQGKEELPAETGVTLRGDEGESVVASVVSVEAVMGGNSTSSATGGGGISGSSTSSVAGGGGNVGNDDGGVGGGSDDGSSSGNGGDSTSGGGGGGGGGGDANDDDEGGGGGGGNGEDTTTTHPNVIFIMVDDMGWNDIGYQSVDLQGVTPHLDKLAAGGIKVSRFLARVGGGVVLLVQASLLLCYCCCTQGSHRPMIPPPAPMCYARAARQEIHIANTVSKVVWPCNEPADRKICEPAHRLDHAADEFF